MKCTCSKDCKCGCQEGKKCTCKENKCKPKEKKCGCKKHTSEMNNNTKRGDVR